MRQGVKSAAGRPVYATARCVGSCSGGPQVAHGKVRDTPLSMQRLIGILKELFRDLEEAGVVPPGTAKEVSGISLRAGGVTEAAACGMEKQLLAGHGIRY